MSPCPAQGILSATDRDPREWGVAPRQLGLLYTPFLSSLWPHHAPSPLGTHSSRQRGSRQLRLHSPCLRHRASAPARTHRCPGTGRILCCRWSSLGKGEAGRNPVTPITGESALLGYVGPKAQESSEDHGTGKQRWEKGWAEAGIRRDGAAARAGTERGESRGWSRLTAAAVLVRAIPTVVCPVTHPELGDAAVVVALKLHGVAELVWERRRGEEG